MGYAAFDYDERDWDRLDTIVKSLTICDNSCNEVGLDELDLSEFVNLRYLEIGKNSFTKYKDTYHITPDPNRHFCLKNCPKLKSLKMGCYSFSDYTVCAIENVDALEVIEMGDLNDWSCNFYYASLELKSILIHNE